MSGDFKLSDPWGPYQIGYLFSGLTIFESVHNGRVWYGHGPDADDVASYRAASPDAVTSVDRERFRAGWFDRQHDTVRRGIRTVRPEVEA